jgi:lipoprotein signal peptidase
MKARPSLFIASGGFFIFLDQFLKWQALHSWSEPRLLNTFLGWDPFLNPGIAFGIPVPTSLVIAITALILLGITFLLVRRWKSYGERPLMLLALILLFAGALSNAIDRIVYRHTIDYCRIFFSIFNVADVLIITGFMLYFFQTQKTNKKQATVTA